MTNAREEAFRQLKSQRRFTKHAVIYAAVIAFLVGIWALTGDSDFWPRWPALAWGTVLLIHAFIAFGGRPISDEDVDRQIARNKRGQP
jgi:fatty acid desaturase